ncbi:hypothetical protein CEXT_30691 [Caerostris extrusa]|uniref:Uncharacterized protein n=1 Tax=Caerostris extrusa TaxID=172846 RepID=A0AAV4R5K7_CAEEX|nr:hypothetical protein CEXT_30691 [Caerostris extrusa]
MSTEQWAGATVVLQALCISIGNWRIVKNFWLYFSRKMRYCIMLSPHSSKYGPIKKSFTKPAPYFNKKNRPEKACGRVASGLVVIYIWELCKLKTPLSV